MKTKNFLYPLLIGILGIGIYVNALFNPFTWDDFSQVVYNNSVHSITNIPNLFLGSTFFYGAIDKLSGIYYKPLLTSTFTLIYSLFGPNPFWFHLLQVFIHIANAILLFIFFQFFFHRIISLILAILFLVHPINTEAVVYVSALQDVLFFFFGIASLILWRESFRTRKVEKKILLSIAVSVFLLLSLLSKETGILFILIGFVFTWLFQKKHLILYSIISFTTLFLYFIFRYAVAKVYVSTFGIFPMMKMSLLERAIHIPKIIFFYILTFLFPKDLAIAQYWEVRSLTLQDFYFPLLVSIIILCLLIFPLYFFKKKKQLKKTYFFFFSWFILGLVFHLQIFPLDLTVAERWFYFTEIGILGITGLWLMHFKDAESLLRNNLFVSFIVLVIVGLSFRTVIRNTDWNNELRLYENDSKISKNSFMLESLLTGALITQERYQEAKAHALQSIKLAPWWAANWLDVGIISENTNDIQSARKSYLAAIKNGNLVLGYEKLGRLELLYGATESAKLVTLRGVAFYPQNSLLWRILALSHYQLGNKKEAISAAKMSYQLDPSQPTQALYEQLQSGKPFVIK